MDIRNIESESYTVNEIIRSYCNIDESDTLGALATEYHVLLSTWADDNSVSVDEVFDRLDSYIDNQAEIEVQSITDESVETVMDLNGIFIHMNWSI